MSVQSATDHQADWHVLLQVGYSKCCRYECFFLSLILSAGCGSYHSVESDTADADQDESLQDGTIVDTSTAHPSNSVVAPEQVSLTQWDGSFVGDNYVDDLLSLYLEILTINLLTPAPPAEITSVTTLELLCRDTDIPDFVCRQRYGQ